MLPPDLSDGYFSLTLQRNSQRAASMMIIDNKFTLILDILVRSWGHLESWKSTASVCRP